MIVNRIDEDGDWTFGQGKSNYLSGSDAVKQNVVTRIKFFKYDWFLDMEAGIDWLNLLSNKDTDNVIVSEVERVTLSTEGVKTITELELVSVTNRNAKINLSFTTVYDDDVQQLLGVEV